MPKKVNIEQAINEYNNNKGELSQYEICEKYGITVASFNYHYYQKPKNNLLKNKIKEKFKNQIISESEKKKKQNKKLEKSDSEIKYVTQPSGGSRRGSRSNWEGHPMKECLIPLEPPRAGSVGSKKIINPDNDFNFKTGKFL